MSEHLEVKKKNSSEKKPKRGAALNDAHKHQIFGWIAELCFLG